MTTNPLLAVVPQPVGSALYHAPALSKARRAALVGVVAAREISRQFPRPIAEAVQLVNMCGGIWGTVATANQWAVAEPRGVSAATLVAALGNARHSELGGIWSTFRETYWPDMRRNVLQLAELLEQYNPRLDMLVSVLNWTAAERDGARVAVRTRTRAAARALVADLSDLFPRFAERLGDGDPTTSALIVVPYSDRLGWASVPTVELHLGVPSPWRRSALLSGEAGEHIVVVDTDEADWLSRSIGGLNHQWRQLIDAASVALDLPEPACTHVGAARTVFGPIAIDSRGAADGDKTLAPLLAIDLVTLFAEFSDAVSDVYRGRDATDHDITQPAAGSPVRARQVTLEPGDVVYWLPYDARIEVLSGDSKYASMPVSALTAGLTLLIPRGETREDLYIRLLAAAHRDVDVMAVELLLRRFRVAMFELHDTLGGWDAVARNLRWRGSTVRTGQTCNNWATGAVIAPDDVEDIRRVGQLIYDDSLTANRMWERLGALAAQLRQLHRELGRLLSGAIGEAAADVPGPKLRRLSALCGGIDVAEVLEEFDPCRIMRVGPQMTVPSGQLRRLLPAAAIQRAST